MKQHIVTLLSGVCILYACSKSDNNAGGSGNPPAEQVPEITAVTPVTGAKATPVTIKGKHFGANAALVKIYFNGVEAAVTKIADTTISTAVPVKAGTGTVKVVINGKELNGPSFEYITSITVSTFAGSGVTGFAEGAGIAAQFWLPLHLCSDKAGNIYVADESGDRIRKITPSGAVSTLAGNGNAGYTNGTGATAQFADARGICTDANNNVYVSDGCHIRKITSGGEVTTLAGIPQVSCGYEDGTPEKAKFAYPYGLCADAAGNIYVAERTNYTIRKITAAGTTSTLAGGTYGDTEGKGPAAQFRYPHAVCMDKAGNLFVIDQSNYKIKKITSDGTVTTLTGGQGYTNGSLAAARFLNMNAICIDTLNNLYVAENGQVNGRDCAFIRKISASGTVSTIAGGEEGYVDGDASQARFRLISGICVDPSGNLFVTDNYWPRIRKITIE